MGQGGLSKKANKVQEDNTCKGIQGSTSKEEIKCVCLNARSIINKKDELNIMVDDIQPHIIGITESWANNDITELGLEGYAMFRKDIIGRRGGGVLLYTNDTIPAYEVQLQEEADCKEVIWCKLVTGHTTVTIGVVYCFFFFSSHYTTPAQCWAQDLARGLNSSRSSWVQGCGSILLSQHNQTEQRKKYTML